MTMCGVLTDKYGEVGVLNAKLLDGSVELRGDLLPNVEGPRSEDVTPAGSVTRSRLGPRS